MLGGCSRMNVMMPSPGTVASACAVLPELADPNSTLHLVTIHGIADAADVWQPVCRYLPRRFASYQQLSLPWHRAVGEPVSYRAPEEVLAEGWRQLPRGRKIVLAHSFGANAFMRLAAIPEMVAEVAALVLLSPYFKGRFDAFTWPLFIRYVNEFERFLNCSIDARSQGQAVSNATRQIVIERLLQNYSPASWVMFYMTWTQTPCLDLSGLTMPCKVMTGETDFSLPVTDVQALSQRIRGAKFHVLQGLGHFALIEDPAATAAQISNFLTEGLLQ